MQEDVKPSLKPEKSLKEELLKAKKRYQPYINLVNEVHDLDEVFSEDSVKEYKAQELKSLYLRTSKLALDTQLGTEIIKLIEIGVREVLIFCDQTTSQLTNAQLNDFLKEHSIRINFKIIQISAQDLEEIAKDEVGQKDLLGFVSVLDHKITYKNGHSIDFLNNEESDKIILGNHAKHKKSISEAHSFTVQEPKYIISNDNAEAEKRIKNPTKKGSKFDLQLEITKNIDLDLEVEEEVEEESELDLDLMQADNKYNEQEAIEHATNRLKRFFYEYYIAMTPDDADDVSSDANFYMHRVIRRIFQCYEQVKFITSLALDVIVKNYFLFIDGINSENMPIGLALKDNIIFVSEQRPSSMPVNDFTIKFNSIAPTISNPLEYSWLVFATKATISLNDIYGTDAYPQKYGYDEHPVILHLKIEDKMLDLPYNLLVSKMEIEHHSHYVIYRHNSDDYKENFENRGKRGAIVLEDIFPGLKFYHLAESDKARLQEIYNQLNQREIAQAFNNIILNHCINDGGFLLEERGTLFLEKLFKEILPLSVDKKKLLFFKRILEGNFQEQAEEKLQLSIEDVFEGLDGCYKRFQELLIKEASTATQKEIETLELQFTEAITKQMHENSGFRVIAERIIFILELAINRGGNIKEQIEYLYSNPFIIQDPSNYVGTKNFGLTTVHKSSDLNRQLSDSFTTQLSTEELKKQLFEIHYNSNSYTRNELLINAFRYLATIPAHQRPSIDSYAKFFATVTSGCNTGFGWYHEQEFRVSKKHLKTSEYQTANVLKHSYRIVEGGKSLECYLIYDSDANGTLGKNYAAFIIKNDKIYFQYKFENEAQDTILLTEQEGRSSGIKTVINYLEQIYSKNSGPIHKLDLDSHGFKIWQNIDLSSLKEFKEHNKKLNSIDRDFVLSIRYIDGNYELYDPNYKDTPLNKTNVTLPSILESKIQEWERLGKESNYIKLSPSEINETIFEAYAHDAHWVSQKKLIEQANGSLSLLTDLVARAEKVPQKLPCFIERPVITEDANLVTNFTIDQAANNIRLLVLNILSSTKEHYSMQYPDQEFASYISLFNVLFSEVKVYDEIVSSESEYKPEEDLNMKTLYVRTLSGAIRLPPEVEAKQTQHKKIIDRFIAIYKDNPEFNFGQIVALGLVANLDQTLSNVVINNAKILLKQYKEHFSQLLRVILSTSVSNTDGLKELNARSLNIAHSINNLLNKVEHEGKEYVVHELLTKEGTHPENLEFFASCLSHKESISYNEIITLTAKLDQLEQGLKDSLLESFFNTPLPYRNGKIEIAGGFPLLSLEMLEDREQILKVIAKANLSYRPDNPYKTRFNDLSLDTKKDIKINWIELENKYGLHIDNETKNKKIREEILEDKDFITNQILKGKAYEVSVIQAISFDLVRLLLESISIHEFGWEAETKQITTLLFNPAKSLRDQLLNIEYSKRGLDALLNTCANRHEREELLNILLRTPKISPDAVSKTLDFIKTIKLKLLHTKGYSLVQLLSSAPQELIVERFDLFKIVTEFFVSAEIDISSGELYQFIWSISKIDSTDSSVKKIIKYCADNSDFSIIHILTNLDCALDNIGKIVDWITTLTPLEIKELNNSSNLNLKELLKINLVEKIQILADVALELKNHISYDQYQTILKRVSTHDIYYARLLKSYLLARTGLAKDARIALVLENIDSLKNLQFIFSEQNLNRFNLDIARLTKKILEIKHKNNDSDNNNLLLIEQIELFRETISVFHRAKFYKDFDSNELHDKAIELKHKRALLKDGSLEEQRNIDLEYIALMLEVMWRETGMFPRDTQVLDLLTTVIHENLHIIHEIATSQGKSVTAAITAAYLCFIGHTVDVASSDSHYAQRDLKAFSSFYHILGIPHSERVITTYSELGEYKKGGVNYGAPSDLALFRADREFFSNKIDLSLNTDVCLVLDEVDFTLTSEVNYKLAIPMIDINQDGLRALFGCILDFVDTITFKNEHISRKDDAENLQLYLKHQFQLYDSSYIYPLNFLQINDLKSKDTPEAKRLYALLSALQKCKNNSQNIFDKLLDAVIAAKQLQEGIDYVVFEKEATDEKPLKAIPLIKNQLTDAVFGEGVQAFLHLLIERMRPELQGKFHISSPSSTIFNVSPKNFIDYYIMTGGMVVGLTATAGDKGELEEFRLTNKLLAISMPRFKEDKNKIIIEEKASKVEQYEALTRYIETDRPMVIFCDNTKEAEEVFDYIKNLNLPNRSIQLCAASPRDTKTMNEAVSTGGDNGQITVTTPILGRAADFFTSHKDGHRNINLCEDTTLGGRCQMAGRSGRNGQEGEFISIFNKENYNGDIWQHMMETSSQERELRMRMQPLTDLLQYFNRYNRDHIISAIKCNEFISEQWSAILKRNSKLSPELQKNYADLRHELVAIAKEKYPTTITKNLDAYLYKLDSGIPAKIEIGITNSTSDPCVAFADVVNNILPYSLSYNSPNPQYYLNSEAKLIESCDQQSLGAIPVFTSYTAKKYSALYVIQNFKYSDLPIIPANKFSEDRYMPFEYRSIPITRVEVPETINDKFISAYNAFYKRQLIVMATHSFTIQQVYFGLFEEYSFKLLSGQSRSNYNISDHEMIIFLDKNNKLYCQHDYRGPLEIKIALDLDDVGISQALYLKLLNHINKAEKTIQLSPEERSPILEFALNNRYIGKGRIEGQGSFDSLMLPELKKSFNAYKELVRSKEVNQLGKLVDNFLEVQHLNVTGLEPGKYQAISITTKITSSDSHAETIMTDGRFLFWINRGYDSTDSKPGVKIFKVIKDIKAIQDVLESFKKAKSQTETRHAIYSLLREDSDKEIPEHVIIEMDPQVIGNCVWVQAISMIFVIALVGRIGNLTELPNIESQEWQEALKDARAPYMDFEKYDMIQRYEAIIYSSDESFKPKFLAYQEQEEINARRKIIDEPIWHELSAKISKTLSRDLHLFDNTIYERQAHKLLSIIKLEEALHSDFGITLKEHLDIEHSEQSAKDLLLDYRTYTMNDFALLGLLHRSIKEAGIESRFIHKLVFSEAVQHMVDNSYRVCNAYKFLDQVRSAVKECSLTLSEATTCGIEFSEELSNCVIANSFDIHNQEATCSGGLNEPAEIDDAFQFGL